MQGNGLVKYLQGWRGNETPGEEVGRECQAAAEMDEGSGRQVCEGGKVCGRPVIWRMVGGGRGNTAGEEGQRGRQWGGWGWESLVLTVLNSINAAVQARGRCWQQPSRKSVLKLLPTCLDSYRRLHTVDPNQVSECGSIMLFLPSVQLRPSPQDKCSCKAESFHTRRLWL